MKNSLFFLASVSLALIASLFVGNICTNMYGLAPEPTLAITGLTFLTVAGSGYASDYLPQGALFMALSAKTIGRNANPKNLGGLAGEHYYAFYEDIATFPTGLNPDFATATTFSELINLASTDLFVMKTGKYFYKFPCVLETGQVKSTMVGPNGSRGFENMASFSNPGNNDDLKGHIAFIANKPVIILCRELNGTIKVLGTKEFPAQLETFESTNGEKVADGDLQKHSFKSCGSIPSPNLTGAVPLEP